MDPAETAADENRRLRRTMRDLVALSTLPAVWIGLGLDGVARSLADALFNTLSLDLVYVRLAGLGGDGVVEVARSSHRPDATEVEPVRAALAELLQAERAGTPTTIPDPFGTGPLHAAVTRFGVGDDFGVLVTGSRHAAFPTERDRLLLGVGANQTAIVVQRRRAEAALVDARSRLDAALAAGAIATWTWDIPNNRLFADHKLARLFNLAEPDAGGGSLDLYVRSIHPDDWPGVSAALGRSAETGADYEADYRIVQADGSVRWVTARGRVERDGAGRPVRMPGVLVDITERKRLEEELRDAARRKDEFLATLAHELRNPLAPIRNSLQILKIPGVNAATVQQVRGTMERQVGQLVRLVDDLLDMSRVMRGKVELRRGRVGLASVVASAVETAQPVIQAQGHRLEISLPPESLPLDADPVRLAQVVGNLLTNAAKYTEPNGRIWLTARREGGQAVLSVQDSGIGIAPDLLPHVFDLFVQADHSSTQAQGGLGIGLTLVKNLVEMHGGTVSARSDGPGQGSEFVVRLPLLAGERPEPLGGGIGDRPQEAARVTGHRLLVVDDNEDAADSLAMLLGLQGHEVRVAHDGPSALAQAQAFRPAMVFLDLGMPGMDGYEVARRLRQQPGLGNVVLAALTGWGQKDDRRRTAEAGFDHHLVKPVEPEGLRRVLADLSPEKATKPVP